MNESGESDRQGIHVLLVLVYRSQLRHLLVNIVF